MSEIQTGKAILLDDNLMSAMRVQGQLESMRYTVRTLRHLDDPLLVVQPPELIVINLGSRGIDGVALVKEALSKFPLSRVVGFCGHKEVEIRKAAKAAGLQRILTNDEALSDLVASL